MLLLNLMNNSVEDNSTLRKFMGILDKLKKDKKALFIVAVGLLGMLLIMLSGNNEGEFKSGNSDINDYSLYDGELIKKELTELIESINGAGKAKVMITYKSDTETVFATDTEDTVRGDEIRSRKEYVIVKKDSDESGIPLKIIFPEIRGVAVICEGGDNRIVKEKIYSLVCSLFQISSNSVSVASMA